MECSKRLWNHHCRTKVIISCVDSGNTKCIVCLYVAGEKCTFLFLTVKHSLAMMKALPDMFPSPVAPPKKLGHASEAMFHILEVNKVEHEWGKHEIQRIVCCLICFYLCLWQSAEDPNTFLQARPLFSPVVIVCETNCLLAIGTTPVVTFPKEDTCASVMYLLACFYTFHLTYPNGIATLLSVLQTEVLLDAIHNRDLTSSYKKSMAEWKKREVHYWLEV